MKKTFIQSIPKTPTFRRSTYCIPEEYLKAFNHFGINDSYELMMLFHLTQFGGFKIKSFPKNIKLDREFLTKWFVCKNERGYFHYRANVDFLKTFGDISIKPLQRMWGFSPVSEKEMLDYGYSQSKIEDSKKFLNNLNDFYKSLYLEIPFFKSGIRIEDRIHLSRFQGIPFLRKKPAAGGRFFHPEYSYQRINSQLRSLMTINGEETTEIDLNAATLQFINICLKKYCRSSIEDIISYEDPYQYFLQILNSEEFMIKHKTDPITREGLKNILYTSIYSPQDKQKSNIDYKLMLMNLEYRYSDLFSEFSSFFRGLENIRENTNLPLHLVINREESRYTQEVLQEGCINRKIPILPLHDSFITTQDNKNNLIQIMDDASQSLYGKRFSYKTK